MCTKEIIQYIIEKLIPTGISDRTPSRYELEDGSYYNVDICMSKPVENCCYVSHK